jgi:fatty-acyl-CoA synthase
MSSAYWPGEKDGALVDLNVGEFLRMITAEVPDRIALKGARDPANGSQACWTYAALLDQAEGVAAALLTRFSPGDHVALWCANRPEWAIAQFGAALAGLVLVAINPASRPNELLHALSLSDSVGIILDREFRGSDCVQAVEQVRDRLPLLRDIILIDDLTATPRPALMPALPAVPQHSAAMIQFTSGTTGRAKAALLSHHGLVNIAQFTSDRFALPKGSTWLNWLPMFHTGGSVFALMGCMWSRGTFVLLNGFDPPDVMRTIQDERAAWLPLVPTTAVALLDHPDRQAFDLSSLEVVTQGGTPVVAELIARIERELGVDHVIVFGQTETSSTICLGVRHDTFIHKTETVGKPMPHTEARIVDPATGRIVDHGETGEIQIRNFALMMGYYGQPEESAQTINAEGWLLTGDLGALEADGYLRVTGRLKDVIIRGGENIYPREIEDLLHQHPGIAEAAVFGIPDERWGETPIAAVRCRAGHKVDHPAVVDYLVPLMARYKMPQDVWILDTMPLTLSGKIQKFVLRDQYIARRDG